LSIRCLAKSIYRPIHRSNFHLALVFQNHSHFEKWRQLLIPDFFRAQFAFESKHDNVISLQIPSRDIFPILCRMRKTSKSILEHLLDLSPQVIYQSQLAKIDVTVKPFPNPPSKNILPKNLVLEYWNSKNYCRWRSRNFLVFLLLSYPFLYFLFLYFPL